MYLHARNVDVDTLSEINIMKFNGGLMTDICIFERYTSGIFNLCCSGEMKRNVKLSNFVAPTPLMNELFKGSTPQSKFFLKNSRLFNTHLSFASITMNEGTKKSVRNNPYP